MEVKIIVPKFPNGIAIGEERENLAVPVVVDYTSWIEQHGAGALQILLQRPQDADPYPVTVTNDNGEAVWTPNETDMNFKGRGEIQLVYTAGGVIERSPVIMVISGRSLVAAGDPPDPFETWLEELTELAAETQQNALDAAGSAEAAGTSADLAAAAKTAAETAQTGAEAAKTGAETAETAAGQSAALARTKAAEAAQAAQTAAQDADYAMHQSIAAGDSAASAHDDAESAAQSAEDAQTAASAAQTAATAAAASASTAAGSAADAAAAVTEVETKGAEQIAAINQAGTTQIAAVDAAGAAQVQAIEDKGAEVLASIPSDYTELTDEVSDLKSAVDQKSPAIYKTAGPAAVVTFDDGADDMPLKSLVVDIPVTQEGSGDPSPENVRAFVGRTGLTLHDTRKNLVDWDSFVKFKGKTWNGLTMDYSDGVYSMTGTATATRTFRLGSPDTTSVNYYTAINLIADYSVFLPAGLYKCSVRVIYGTDLGKPSASANNGTAAPNTAFELTQASWVMPIMSFSNGNTYDTHNELMLWQADENDTYEPYEGRTVAITFPAETGTVYGGALTLNADGSADLVSAYVIYNIQPSQWTWMSSSRCFKIDRGSLSPRYKVFGRNVDNRVADIASDKYKPNSFNNIANSVGNPNYSVGIREYNAQWIALRTDGTNSVLPEECQIKLPLANPITYHISDAGQLKTLLGVNNIWADAGDVTVEYPADTKLYIDAQTKATRQLIAGIETSMTASRAYSVGELLIVGDALYRVIAAIANGATLTPGTNVTATTVAEQLLLLANL